MNNISVCAVCGEFITVKDDYVIDESTGVIRTVHAECVPTDVQYGIKNLDYLKEE